MGKTIVRGGELLFPLRGAMIDRLIAWWVDTYPPSLRPDCRFVKARPADGRWIFAQRNDNDDTIEFVDCYVRFQTEDLYEVDSAIIKLIGNHNARLKDGAETAASIDEWSSHE